MSKYLLNAPDDEMKLWKACAEAQGQSFAAWLREACRVASNNVAEYDFVYELVDEQKLKHAKIKNVIEPVLDFRAPYRREFRPDPKPTKKR